MNNFYQKVGTRWNRAPERGSNYEITDHLGNVRAVIKKVNGNPIMQAYADYYPFGEQLPGRNSLSNYRYAFQGQELDGETNMEAFQLRLWDGRIGRWLNPDPYGQYASPYLGMGNNPIGMIDPDGGLAFPERDGAFCGDSWTDSDGSWTWDSDLNLWVGQTLGAGNWSAQLNVFSQSKVNNIKMNFDATDGKRALYQVYIKYGSEMSKNVERIYRSETSHFMSKQYRLTGTGGMEAHGKGPYYGWDSEFFINNPEYAPIGTTSMFEGKGLSGLGGNAQIKNRPKIFVVMPSVEAGMMYLVNYINRYHGNYARWHSTNPNTQEVYRNALNEIRPRFTNEFNKRN